MQNFDGAPRTQVEVNDTSVLAVSTKRSFVCVQGVTALGIPGVAYKVSNEVQFRRLLGGYHSRSLFALYCIRALQAGAALVVVPVGHYTDVADPTTLTGTKASATKVVTGSGAGTSVFTAKAPSEGYNGVRVTVSESRSRTASAVDITEELPGVDGTANTIYDVSQTPTDSVKTGLNKKLKFVDLTSFTTLIPLGVSTLAGGVQDVDGITDNDYIGDIIGKTGWFAFDKVTKSKYYANLERPVPAVDLALANYCAKRKDARFIVRTPIGLTAEGMLDYRNGTGLYSHSPLDTELGLMIGGEITVYNPLDANDLLDISPIADALGARCTTDLKEGSWYSFAGSKRGRVQNTVGIPYNLGSSGLSDEANDVANAGIMYVNDHETFGPCFWGNRSLKRDTSKLTASENIANFAMHLQTSLPIFGDSELFEPNDQTMWSQVYRNARPFIEDLEARRAIEPGENKNWFWYGDQNAFDETELVYNKIEDIQRGIYVALFLCKPKNATSYIGLRATVTDAKTFQISLVQQ